ncbi:PQQ-binding-like beta-propeller repeat protein [Kribbella sp. NPDC005582]|uniref:outer membrane protein assembly factor BamB family protein n=1 Tax=Kribbella sp. NPDC005582 TaxID=3156893 RepID=UPI0033B07E1C
MQNGLRSRGRNIRWAVLALVGLAGVVWAIAVPRPVLYVVGVLLCLPLVVAVIPRRVVGVLAAVIVLVAAIAVPKIALVAQTRGDVRWSAALKDQVSMSTPINVWTIGERIYLLSAEQPLRAFDKTSGRLLADYPDARYKATAVAADGSVVGWSHDDEVTYYAADGGKLWTKPFRGRGAIGSLNMYTPVVAAADGVVVLADCTVQLPAKPCRWTGLDRSGRTVWEQQDDRAAVYTPARTFMFNRTIAPLPSVLLGLDKTGEFGAYVVRAAADGRELGRRPAQPLTSLGLQGDLVVIAERVGDDCRLVGLRAGKQVLATQGMPCVEGPDGKLPGFLRLTPDRAYLEDSGNARTVSLKDGSWRSVTGLTFSTGDEPAVAGSDVIIYRNGSKLSAVDAASGKPLWSKTAPGKVVEVYVDNGGLLVFSRPRLHNPLFSGEDGAIQASSWVAATGERTGTRLIRDGDATRGAATGPGEALLVNYRAATTQLLGTR